MERNGFSLIELIVVICVIGTLVSLATLRFNELARKSGIEGQTKMLYADLMKLRAHALFERHRHVATFSPTRFAIYSSNRATGTPVMARELRYPLKTAGVTLHFNEHGLADNSASICVDDDAGEAGYDSLVVFVTRVQMGKRDAGGNCATEQIRTR